MSYGPACGNTTGFLPGCASANFPHIMASVSSLRRLGHVGGIDKPFEWTDSVAGNARGVVSTVRSTRVREG